MEPEFKEKRFAAEAEYAESIFQTSIGNIDAAIDALERTLEIDDEYAPAILSMGSVEYQRGEPEKGMELFLSLISLPVNAAGNGENDDLAEIIDKAGDFLIQERQYVDGLELKSAAIIRFPEYVPFYQGIGCCAGHEELHHEAISASETALKLEPENQELVNDLGWSLLESGRITEAKKL